MARLLAERPECEAQIENVCVGDSHHIHEVLARSAGGSISDESNLKAVCFRCHNWIGDNPIEAIKRGLRRSRYPGRDKDDPK